jgi:hypothetical protein
MHRIPGRKKEMGKIKRDNEGKMENEKEEIEREATNKDNEIMEVIKGERRDRNEERTKKARELKNKTIKQIIFFQGLSF